MRMRRLVQWQRIWMIYLQQPTIIYYHKTGLMIQSNEFQFEQDIPWEDVGNGITRQIFGYDDRVMLVKAKFEKGGVGAVHQHPHSQATYVDSGVFEMTIGDVKKIIRK